jgi:hypothetical protein
MVVPVVFSLGSHQELIEIHLDSRVWSFGFDHAKMRAGLCDFGKKRISLSRYLAARYDDDEVKQVLLQITNFLLLIIRA